MLGLQSIPINFKEVFTTRILQFHVNPFHTVTQFIESIRPALSAHFNINQNDVEIIEGGQYINGNLAEAAPGLLPENRRLRDIWGPELRYLSFYVRRKNHLYPQLENNRREIEANQINTENIPFTEECPICLDSTTLIRRYTCTHGLCSTCYGRCQTASINTCSLCRSH
jgi:hypothetical protein